MAKTSKKILEENIELKGALRAFGRMETTITKMEQGMQQDAMKMMALMEYSKSLGGDEVGFNTFLEGKIKEEMLKQQQSKLEDGGATAEILDEFGKPMKTEGKK